MAEPNLDHPGEMHWWRDFGPAPVAGPCPHSDCPHNMLGTIAEGPDFEHYTLVTCDVDGPDGCDGQCRAWTVEYPAAQRRPWFTSERPKFRLKPFLHVPPREAVRS